MNRQAYDACCEPLDVKSKPRTIVDAQFSIPYAVARAICSGRVSIEHFTEQAIREKVVLDVAAKVKPEIDAEIEVAKAREISPAIVTLVARGGHRLTKRVDLPKGHPENPMTFEEIVAKFRDCVANGIKPLSEQRVAMVLDTISNLEQINDASFISLLEA